LCRNFAADSETESEKGKMKREKKGMEKELKGMERTILISNDIRPFNFQAFKDRDNFPSNPFNFKKISNLNSQLSSVHFLKSAKISFIDFFTKFACNF
jgi:hypothetical protein